MTDAIFVSFFIYGSKLVSRPKSAPLFALPQAYSAGNVTLAFAAILLGVIAGVYFGFEDREKLILKHG